MYDIVIIGAGTAGLTSAIYGLRSGKKVLCFESKSYGGQIIDANKIDNYPGLVDISGYDFATNLYNQAINLGLEVKFEKVTKITKDKDIETTKGKYKAKTIIIASGTEKKKLGLENEDNLIGKGISYCATCDGFFYKNKVVAVVGGGNVALDDALYLSNICKTVYLIHRRNDFRGEQTLIDNVKNKDNIICIYSSNVSELLGKDNITGIKVLNDKDEIKNLDIDGLFIGIGRLPNTDMYKDILEIDEYNYIITNELMHTNIPGIFAIGDVRSKELRQLVTATSDGAIAATEAVKYINNNSK